MSRTVPRAHTYTLGRMAAVAIRPICLFVANDYFPPQAARIIAVAFLASSLSLVVTAADSHRLFYLRHFAAERQSSAQSFYVYLMSIVLLTVLGTGVVLGVAWTSGISALAATCAVVYFVSERLADELLRIRLFEHDFDAWGRAMLRRAGLQAFALVALFILAGDRVPGTAAVALLAAANFIVFVPQLPRSLVRAAGASRRLVPGLFPRSIRSLVSNWRVWAVALAGSSVAYLDRIVALTVDIGILPLFTLVVMAFSIVQMSVDFFYVSRHRRDFLQQRISLRDALTSRGLLGSLAGGLGLAGVACAGVLYFSRNGSTFPLVYVGVIAVLQTSVAVTLIPQQILYWNQDFGRLLAADAAFWMLIALALVMIWLIAPGSAYAFAAVAVCAAIRFGIYALQAVRVPGAHQRDLGAVVSELV